jgi:hypothetical protein
MKKVFWMNSESAEQWKYFHHFELLIEDLTGFNFRESLCEESVKYMAKRLAETKYSRRFKTKYTIFEDEYCKLVEDFKNCADTNIRIEVSYETQKVC